MQTMKRRRLSADAWSTMVDSKSMGLKPQLEWFKRQIFGSKSERFAPEPDLYQLPLASVTTAIDPSQPLPRQTVITHTRREATEGMVH